MAWPLKSLFAGKKKSAFDLSYLGADIHSHLIPGIDDGAKSMEEAVELVEALAGLGYRKLITTPHVMHDAYPNTPEMIQQGIDALRAELRDRGIDIVIEAAAEYYLDEHFLGLLEQGKLLSFGDNHVLFETSYTVRPYALHDHIYAMKSRGYRPVMAHPERYSYLHGSFDEYLRIKEMGVLFQLNLNSLAGYYSAPVKKAAEWIIEEGLVDFVGTDTHRLRHVDFFDKAQQNPYFQKMFDKNTILNSTLLSV